MSKEALKLAQEGVEIHAPNSPEYIVCAALIKALAQPEQEPIAYFNAQVKGGFYWAKPTKITAPITVNVEPMPLYTAPPQRKPLTVDEVWQNDQLMSLNAQLCCGMDLLMEVVEAIEAAHNIKE